MSKEKTKNICLKTKRLEIFPKSLEEMRKLQEQEQDPQMKQAYGEMIDGMETHPKDWFWYSDWTVAFKDKTVVGGICFKGAPDEKGEVEIGYGMEKNFRRHGYAFEALEKIIDWAFSDAKVYFVMAETLPDNEASKNLLKKLDFTPTGTFGEEGPRFERERPKPNNMSIYMMLGLSLGICFGTSVFDNAGVGMCMGMLFGVAIGSSLDAADKKKRGELQEMRAADKENYED